MFEKIKISKETVYFFVVILLIGGLSINPIVRAKSVIASNGLQSSFAILANSDNENGRIIKAFQNSRVDWRYIGIGSNQSENLLFPFQNERNANNEKIAIFPTGESKSADAVINLGPIKPQSFGWGQTAQYSLYVSQNGKPVKKARVEYWFSGQRSLESLHYSGTTNAEGRLTFSKAIPRDWEKKTKWADLNASSTSVAAANRWRVKG